MQLSKICKRLPNAYLANLSQSRKDTIFIELRQKLKIYLIKKKYFLLSEPSVLSTEYFDVHHQKSPLSLMNKDFFYIIKSI